MDDYGRSRAAGVGTEIAWYDRRNPAPPDAISYGGRSYPRDNQVKKAKNPGASSSKVWGFSDPEFQRKKRVASYKMYGYEGEMAKVRERIT